MEQLWFSRDLLYFLPGVLSHRLHEEGAIMEEKKKLFWIYDILDIVWISFIPCKQGNQLWGPAGLGVS